MFSHYITNPDQFPVDVLVYNYRWSDVESNKGIVVSNVHIWDIIISQLRIKL